MRWYTLLFLFLALLFPAVSYAALVNINTADAALLDTLPGIGPAKAQAIIDHRTKNGLFKTIEEIQNVSGIGPVTYENLKASITVDSAPAGGGQPPVKEQGYKKVQEVGPITREQTDTQAHEEGIRAPAGATELAPAGAALPEQKSSRASGLFRSPWTFGLVGVILLAGGVFIFI